MSNLEQASIEAEKAAKRLEQALSDAEDQILTNDYYCKNCKNGTLIMSRQDKTYLMHDDVKFAFTAELTIVCEVQAKKLILFQEVFDNKGEPDWTKQDVLDTIRFCAGRKLRGKEQQEEADA